MKMRTCIFPQRDIKNGRQHWRPWKLLLSEDVAAEPAHERDTVKRLRPWKLLLSEDVAAEPAHERGTVKRLRPWKLLLS